MKKNSMKKLTLSRETVRILEDQLGKVMGGITGHTCANSCDTAVNSYCDCTSHPVVTCNC
jgi:hypothetical protein